MAQNISHVVCVIFILVVKYWRGEHRAWNTVALHGNMEHMNKTKRFDEWLQEIKLHNKEDFV